MPLALNTVRSLWRLYAIGVYCMLTFVETHVFTRRVTALLTDAQFSALQWALGMAPDYGDIIPGTGGLRKVRWGIEGRGKRGGLRVIYYWSKPAGVIYLLLVFEKTRRVDLTVGERRALAKLVREELA